MSRYAVYTAVLGTVLLSVQCVTTNKYQFYYDVNTLRLHTMVCREIDDLYLYVYYLKLFACIIHKMTCFVLLT